MSRRLFLTSQELTGWLGPRAVDVVREVPGVAARTGLLADLDPPAPDGQTRVVIEPRYADEAAPWPAPNRRVVVNVFVEDAGTRARPIDELLAAVSGSTLVLPLTSVEPAGSAARVRRRRRSPRSMGSPPRICWPSSRTHEPAVRADVGETPLVPGAEPVLTVVPGRTPGLAAEPVGRPDGGWLWPVTTPGVRPSAAGVAVDVRPARPGDTPDRLTDAAEAALGPEHRVVDREATVLAGQRAVRVLLLIDAPGPVCVVLEQWRAVVSGTAVVVTATADLASWAQLSPVLRAAVAGLRVEGAA